MRAVGDASGRPSLSLGLSGKAALVTGASSGLGRHFAEVLATAGAKVAVAARRLDLVESVGQAIRERGGTAVAVRMDVTARASVDEAVMEAAAALGGLDIVVNNAGVTATKPFLDVSPEEWDRVIDTNLKGVFLTCQAAARAMVAAGHGGRIVTVGSGAASTAYWGWSHYCASKAAVVMLTKAMALELGGHGIRVNAVLPGYIDVDEGGRHLDEAYKAAARAAIPLGRPGEPSDIAGTVLMLASPLAYYVSGAALAVDGGSSAGRLGSRPVAE